MNPITLKFNHDCSDDIESMTQKADKVLCNYIRVNQWAHAEETLRIQGQKRGFTLEYEPESGEVIPVPIDTYVFYVRAATSLLSSWTDIIECFKDVRPQPRKFSGETYPLVRAVDIANAEYSSHYFVPKHSGRMRILCTGNAGDWSLQTFIVCGTTELKQIHPTMTITAVLYEDAGGRSATTSFAHSAFLVSGRKYLLKLRNTTGVTDSINIDVTIEPDS